MRRATHTDRVKYLDAAIQILGHVFVSTEKDADIVNFLKAWTNERWLLHERCLPHVIHLIAQCKNYNIKASNEEDLLGLLLPCEMYAEVLFLRIMLMLSRLCTGTRIIRYVPRNHQFCFSIYCGQDEPQLCCSDVQGRA